MWDKTNAQLNYTVENIMEGVSLPMDLMDPQ